MSSWLSPCLLFDYKDHQGFKAFPARISPDILIGARVGKFKREPGPIIGPVLDRFSGFGQGDPGLALVFAAPVPVRHVAHFIGFEEQHLGYALVGIDFRR